MNTLTQTPPISLAHRGLIVEGARDMTPMVIGVVPFALAIGAAIGTSSVPLGAGLLSGPLILAGSAQILTLEMLDSGAPALVVILSAVLVNARILLYGAALAPWFADQPLRRRLLLAIPVIDQTHFVCGARFTRGDLDSTGRVLCYIGAAGWLVSAWLGAQLAQLDPHRDRRRDRRRPVAAALGGRPMTALIAVLVIGASTYLLRVAMFLVVTRDGVHERWSGSMSLVAPAALAALVGSMLLTERGAVAVAPTAEVVAVAAGFVAARITGNVASALFVGLPTMWLLGALGM